MGESATALRRLDEITRRLRTECAWDREQDERSIVPHTVEEAYELADAAYAGDDAKLLDELGDVLFQVYFLSLLMEERGAGDLAAVADHCRTKLIRRHPHVFGDVEAADASEVLRNWDEIKRTEEGRGGELFAGLPETLPGLLYASKVLRRGGSDQRADKLRSEADRAAAHAASESHPDARFEAVGDLLLAAVALARELGVDPELAVRAAADRLRREVEAGR